MLRRAITLLPRPAAVVCRRAGSSAPRPLPPPSSLKNIGEYIEPKWVAEEHMAPMYRSIHVPSRAAENFAVTIGTIMWTWILFGLWYEWDHVVGHLKWPNAKQWTDKELGIPDHLEFEPEAAE